MRRKLTLIAVLTLLVCALIPMGTVSAETVTILMGTNGTPYDLSVLSNGDTVAIGTTELVELTGGEGKDITIQCINDANVELIEVSITCTGTQNVPIGFGGGNNTLTITGTNTLTAGIYASAVYVADGATLTIGGEGTLTANGGAGEEASNVTGGAGIGGNTTGTSTIIIAGGTINAAGGRHSAGIGGSFNGSSTITIEGGTITASGGYAAAGIGGGMLGTGTVTISGGTISATTGDIGAGIGSGASGEGIVTITGGSIEAQGGTNGAGIGSGASGDATVDIQGGTIVSATGGTQGAGIGSGVEGAATITITTGTITEAQGGEYGAGIGSGGNASADITIEGGTITLAQGGTNAAGIGSGPNASACAIGITDGTITAVAGDYAAGLGGGLHVSPTITIENGTIDATGGTGAAGIGGGTNASCDVTINDGLIWAVGGTSGTGIGNGNSCLNFTSVEIYGGEVYAEGLGAANDIGDSATSDAAYVLICEDSVVFLKNDKATCPDVFNHQHKTSATITVAEGAEYGSAYGYTKIPASWGNGNSAYAYIPMVIETSVTYRFANAATGEYLQTVENAAADSIISAGAKATSTTQTFKLVYKGEDLYWIESCETPELYLKHDGIVSPESLAPGSNVVLANAPSSGIGFYFNQDDAGNIKIIEGTSGDVIGIYMPDSSLSTEIFMLEDEDDNDYLEWTMCKAETYQVVNGKMRVTYYRAAGSKERMDIYYGETVADGIQSRYLYDETGLKTQMTAYNTAGKRTTMTKYHDNGKAKYKYFYNTTTNVKKSMMSYNTAGKQIAKTEYYANGVSAKRQYLYYATGKKKIIKNFRTNKKLSSQTWFYTDGTSRKQFNTYNVNGKLTSVSKYRQNGTRYYYKKY